MTREAFNKLSERQKKAVLDYKVRYKNTEDSERQWEERKAIMRESNSYLKGLRDAGSISERERQALFTYTTI